MSLKVQVEGGELRCKIKSLSLRGPLDVENFLVKLKIGVAGGPEEPSPEIRLRIREGKYEGRNTIKFCELRAYLASFFADSERQSEEQGHRNQRVQLRIIGSSDDDAASVKSLGTMSSSSGDDKSWEMISQSPNSPTNLAKMSKQDESHETVRVVDGLSPPEPHPQLAQWLSETDSGLSGLPSVEKIRPVEEEHEQQKKANMQPQPETSNARPALEHDTIIEIPQNGDTLEAQSASPEKSSQDQDAPLLRPQKLDVAREPAIDDRQSCGQTTEDLRPKPPPALHPISHSHGHDQKTRCERDPVLVYGIIGGVMGHLLSGSFYGILPGTLVGVVCAGLRRRLSLGSES
jgi:hypothetical protein